MNICKQPLSSLPFLPPPPPHIRSFFLPLTPPPDGADGVRYSDNFFIDLEKVELRFRRDELALRGWLRAGAGRAASPPPGLDAGARGQAAHAFAYIDMTAHTFFSVPCLLPCSLDCLLLCLLPGYIVYLPFCIPTIVFFFWFYRPLPRGWVPADRIWEVQSKFPHANALKSFGK
jgi:hypothetical protein